MKKKQKAVEVADTPLLPEPNEAYVDWTGAAGKRTGYVLTMADAERIVRESASWPVPTYGGFCRWVPWWPGWCGQEGRTMDERYPALLDPAIGPAILRRVVLATIYQAVLDGRANTARLDPNPGALKRNAAEALTFLNHQTTAEIASAFGVMLPDNITPESLRVMSRGVSRPRVRKQKAVAA